MVMVVNYFNLYFKLKCLFVFESCQKTAKALGLPEPKSSYKPNKNSYWGTVLFRFLDHQDDNVLEQEVIRQTSL